MMNKVIPKQTELELTPYNKDATSTRVELRVVILTLHDVDTVNERFTAEIYIEGRWKYNYKNYSDIEKLQAPFVPEWKPNLQVTNLVSETKSETWYKLGRNNDGIYAFEMKKIKGVFYEKLELHNYPFDVQDLSIKISVSHGIDVCVLRSNPQKMPNVIVDTFRDSQEWHLYHYVSIEESNECEEKKDTNTKYSLDGAPHSLIEFNFFVARQATYFYWNAFFLVFLITIVSFCPFAVAITSVANRIQTTVTLMLTSVSFKWVINRSLPPISYLTTLDLYSIFGVAWMAVLCSWHALYGAFNTTWNNTWIESGFLIAMGCLFVLINISCILYLTIGIYQPRRHFHRLEKQFQKQIDESKKEAKNNEMVFIL